MLDEPVANEHHTLGVQASEDLPQIIGNIEFSKVHFSFDDSVDVLTDLNFKIKSGTRVAITGPSGSGKSTTTNLLPRFISPSSGDIFIEGQPIENYPIEVLRSAFAIAFQEVFLFNATISENLRYARTEASAEEVARVCELTGADKVIERLPKRMNTKLSDFGVELSRGEKQRITLARALLKDSPILILDEATASIDRDSSHDIVERISMVMPEKTMIIVTHEMSLLNLVDHVISIRDGLVDFEGSPEVYLRKEFGNSIYESTQKSQSNIPRSESQPQPTQSSDIESKDQTELAPSVRLSISNDESAGTGSDTSRVFNDSNTHES